MENHLKIRTGRSLSATIDAIVKESIKQTLQQTAAAEAERQRVMGEEDEDVFAGTPTEDEKPETSKTIDAEKEKLKKGKITADDVIEKLNTIRGGKSFKDEAIAAKMNEYVESLSKAEKTALLAFLKGLAQIVTGEVPASKATDPSDAPAGVEMKKTTDVKQTKSIKPNVIKSPPKEKSEKKPSSEDTSGPVPITPKKAK